MSQHDFTIANQTASSARSDINNALQALATNNSGASAPSTTYASMWWYDTGANILKQRNEGDTAWVSVAYINQSTNKFEILDDTKVVTTSGTQVGILGDQPNSTWQTGTGTTESLVSPAKVAAAIGSLGYTQPTSYGAVGTYALLYENLNNAVRYVGTQISGSNLYYSSVGDGANHGAGPTGVGGGTWQAMGSSGTYNFTGTTNTDAYRTTVWLRIS